MKEFAYGQVAYSKNEATFESIMVTLSYQTQSSGFFRGISVDEPYDSTCEVNTYHPSYGSR